MTKLLICLAFCALVSATACGDDSAKGHAAGDENAAASAALSGDMPCDVRSLITKYCATCHGQVPTGGAPMALVTADAWQAKASNGEYVHARALEKLVDKTAPMPPVARPQPTAGELATLTRWLQGGAQKSSETCSADAGVAQAGDITPLPPAIPDSECEVMLELRTHDGDVVSDTPYSVTAGQEHYQCFYFPTPWLNKMQILKIEPLIDNAKVLHHFLLYQEQSVVAGQVNGHSQNCVGSHPTASLLTGWAPGGFGVSMPPDVGLQIGSGDQTQFNLEVHYNNTLTGVDQADRSGVRICATSKLRKNEAAAHWLGTEFIVNPPGQGIATSSCTPKAQAHILSVSPHMHKTGRHMKTEIVRASGVHEILTDRAFDFADQQIYPVGGAAGEVLVGPGDVLNTTCTYENDTGKLVTFGSLTSQEMCYNFVVAWPIGALETGGGIVTGPNRCQQ